MNIINPLPYICGRPPGQMKYKEVTYHEKEYIVGNLPYKNEIMWFVIDKEDYPKIKDMSWHRTSNAYIAHSMNDDNKQKQLYLHNVVMDRMGFLGKGQTETVDHINRIASDNRKENLRIVSQTEQNLNQKRKGRTIELPEDSCIKAEDIPKHIWYVKANGSHGDRFCIELKTEKLVWKTSASKKISLADKLKEAKEKLKEIYMTHPHLNPDNIEKIDHINSLKKSYEEIVALAII